MAHHFIFDPDPAKSASAADEVQEKEAVSSAEPMPEESDLAELAAKFALHGGGQVSPEISADLALEVVLNEIAEQACLATPASGAAIVLKRDGEWVCRASAGDNSPRLGARLSAEAGLSGACITTRQMQRCDDAQADPRADIEACRILGVRSVIILPLLKNDEVMGVFEVFSSQASAFGGRDERTLEVLSQRLLTILKPISEPPAASREPAEVPVPTGSATALVHSPDPCNMDRCIPPNVPVSGQEDRSHRAELEQKASEVANSGINFFTWILGAAVLAVALLLAVRAEERLTGGRSRVRAHPTTSPSKSPNRGRDSTTVLAGASATPAAPKPSNPQSSRSSEMPPAASTLHGKSSVPPPGSLLVYENGKEIFRMPPAADEGERNNRASATRTGSPTSTVDRAGPVIVPAGIYELSPEVAEGSLLHRVEPDYPEKALQQQIQGPVELDVRIERNGSVQEAKLVTGQPLLADAAIAAVKQWRFRPHLVKGQAVEMQTKVTLNFRLPR